MALSFLKPKRITHNLINIPGWRSKRKIVVFESDDWGSVRMASKEALNYFLKLGYPVDKDPYNYFDALESNDDLELLLNVLSSVKDKNGNGAIFTANCLVANPDFERIKSDNFQNYYYEPFTKTLARYPNHNRVYRLYQEGIANNLLKPQFHGREHLNVPLWMASLQEGRGAVLEAFKFGMFSVHAESNPVYFNEYTDALAFHTKEQYDLLPDILADGLNVFRNIWGFNSESFMAPCYIWSSALEETLSKGGVRYLQGMINQFQPILGVPFKYKLKYHYLGQLNNFGQRYLIRNVFFEPTHKPGKDSVGESLKRIEIAFTWGKPAIISSHRLNYMGSLDPANRSKGLKLLKQLLAEIVARWPDVEFMSSDELGNLIDLSKKAG